MNRLLNILLVTISFYLTSCTASMLMGDVIRSGQKDIEVVTPPGSSISDHDINSIIGISLDGIGEGGESLLYYGSGSANKQVYSDMLQMELLKNGYSARSIGKIISENSPLSDINSLASNGIDVVISGNLSLGTSTSLGAAYTGGNYWDTGISSFTVKGIDTRDGSLLFLISGEYGKAKKPSVVTEDIFYTYNEIISGNPENYNTRSATTVNTISSDSQPSSPPINNSSRNRMNDTEWVQSTLNEMGYNCGVADGIIGANTRSCIRAFQSDNNLRETGSVNETTYQIIINKTQTSENETNQPVENEVTEMRNPPEQRVDNRTEQSYSFNNSRETAYNLSGYTGIGNSLGWFGIQAEKYLSDGKYSAFGGFGYYPSDHISTSGGTAFAVGFRIFSEVSNQRYFGEASYSMLAYRGIYFGNDIKYYGPGAQIGYQVIGDGRQSFLSLVLPEGLTLLASAGLGYADVQELGESNIHFVFGVSVGYSIH